MAPSAVPIEDPNSGSSSPTRETSETPVLPASYANGTNGTANGTANGHSANGVNGTTNGVANGTAEANGLAPETAPVDEPEPEPKFPPVAIIGMSCRLPGGVSDPDDFYQLIVRLRSGWMEMPADRFSKDGYHHPNPDKLGCYNPIGGCFLSEDVAAFDAPFFNITEREALSMDPQHRLILECTWEALENAGIPRHKLVGKDVAVYAGGSFTDYELNNLRDLETAPMYQSTGNAPSLLSNRISYYFDLRGPSHTIETACSSSLTALHVAMRAIHCGDASMAILASSHLNLLPDHFVSMSSQGLLSSDGRSYAFDERANGFGRGEGAGVVILKPLKDALRDNDKVRAVIVGSGLNQDGKTNGITMPNGESQLDLMKKVYADAGLDPRETAYVEAHGTGTKVGDPLEMEALHNMFWEDRTPQKPLYVGSVKTNVGHLEGASGIVSMIKSTMMLERGYILPNFDFRKGNPKIPFDEWGIKVPAGTVKWPRGKKYVSINSFGFGGGNAHCVLAAAPKPPRTPTKWLKNYVEPRRMFALTANSKESLVAQMQNLSVYLERHPVAFQWNLLANLAYTLGQRRSFLPYKHFITANDGAAVTAALASPPTNPPRSTRPPTIGFVFTGQGAQWHAMGRELMDSYPIFKASIERFDEGLKRIGAKFSMMEELLRDKETSRLSDAELSQPGCTAIQLALTDLLTSWGVRPNAVIGHSSGEIGAAYAAGVLSHEDCAAVAYFRGQSVLHLKDQHPGLAGGMLAVGAGADDVWPIIDTLGAGKVTIACHNSPGSITASGDDAAITELAAKIEEKQLFNRRVRVDTAYHSHHMELVAEWYGKSIGKISASTKTDVKFFSSLRGHQIDCAELTTSYWVHNLTQPVLFSQALTEMCKPEDGKENIDLLVELGPHSAMEGPVKQVLKAIENLNKKPTYLPTLVRNKDAVETTMNTAGNLFNHGVLLEFEQVNFPVAPPKALEVLNDLPKYAWNHSTRYWWETRISKNHLHRPFKRNDVLGALADFSNELEPTWRTVIRTDEMPWVRGHNFQDMIVYPMAGYLAMAVEAAAQRAQLSSQAFDRFSLKDVSISRPLVIQEGSDSEVNITLRPFTEGTRQSSKAWDEFRVFSWNKERNWLEHCRGLIRVEQSTETNPVHRSAADEEKAALKQRIEAVTKACSDPVDAKQLYQELENVTAKYNKEFQSMENCTASDTNCVADIIIPDTAKTMPKEFEPSLYIHPAFLDQFTHAAWVILGAGRGKLPALYMPKHLKSLTISAELAREPGTRLRLYGAGNPEFGNPGSTKITMFATSMDGGKELISMEELVVDPMMEADVSAANSGPRELCYRVAWEPLKSAEEPEPEVKEEETAPAAAEAPAPIAEAVAKVSEAVSDAVKAVTGSSSSASEPAAATAQEGEAVVAKEPETAAPKAAATEAAPAGAAPEVAAAAEEEVKAEAEPVAQEPEPPKVPDFNDSFSIICTPEQEAALASEVKSQFSEFNVSVGSLDTTQAAGKIAIVLLELEKPVIANFDATTFEKIQTLAQSVKGILWVVRGAYTDSTDPKLGMVIGLSRTVRSELGLKFATLDLDGVNPLATAADVAQTIFTVAKHVFGKDSGLNPDMEFQERNGELSVCKVYDDFEMDAFVEHHTNPNTEPFLQPFSQPGRPLKIHVGTKGALDTLHFVDDAIAATPLPADEISIEVKVTSMNFKDIMVSMGEVPSPYLGVECAGIVNAVGSAVTDFKVGDRVCASSEGAYSTYARCKSTSAAKVPDNMSLESGATVPVVFATAYYGLFDIGHLQKGERVLIHAAAGGVGQAAIMLCQMVNADIYATVGSQAKKSFLMDTYGIPEDRIFFSRDVTFAKGVMRATEGRGVDVVLNSLAGDALRATWECMAHFGRFIEIGKRDILANSGLQMAVFEHNATFASVDLTVVASERPTVMRRVLDDVFRLLEQGTIRPISPITTYPISNLETAFRTLQAGKAHGKLLVTAAADDMVKATYSEKTFASILKGDATYVIIGGTGGIGRSMTKWMVRRGAKNVVLVSRSDKISDKVAEVMEDAKSLGAKVVLKKCDVASSQDVDRMVAEVSAELPPIRGVIHSAMVLDDVLFEKMKFNQWETVVQSKVAGCWNLHTSLDKTPLDFFIALSSVAGIIGNNGQAAYAAANCFLDSFVQFRRRQGQPATTLNLAAVSDTGYLAENAERQKEVLAQIGGEAISEKEILALVAAAITGKSETTCQSQVVTGLKLPTNFSNVFWTADAKFASLCARAASEQTDGAEGGAAVSPGAALKRATSYDEAHKIVIDALLDKTAGVLMLPREELDPTKDTVFYGLDSLVSIEIRNWITREFGAALQILDLISSGSFIALADTVLKKTEMVSFEKTS